ARDVGAQAIHLDLTDPDACDRAIDGVTVLVNNAGVLWDDKLFDDMDHFEATMDTALHGPYSLIRAALPAMKKAGYGRVVNLSSGWGSFAEGLGGGGAYGIGKAAMNALTVIADRDTPDFIKINAMCPGWVRTRMGGAGANRSPEEAADTAIWLATLPADGPSGGFFRDRRPIRW
ncbi:MAG: SDR family NAD(P)-dependent oxidoreductase, partial [Pseudomonadota bacterium]